MHDTDPKPHFTRRHLIGGLAGVGVATALSADSAGAADGSPVVIGAQNQGKTVTVLRMANDYSSDSVLQVEVDDEEHAGLVVLGPTTAVRAPYAGYGLHVVGPADGLRAEGHGSGVAVQATSEQGPAIASESLDGVTLRLQPADRVGPPTDPISYLDGALSVDQNGDLWVCVAAGAPGTWTRLLREDDTRGRTIPITPIRVLDTRAAGGRPSGAPAVPGQIHGPINGGQVVTLDLAGIDAIPASASGLIGTASVLTPSSDGYVRLLPSGAAVPASTVNYTKAARVSTGFTSGLGPGGLSAVAPIGASATYHLVIDIAAYIT